MTDILRELSAIRPMQIYADLCLWKYCAFHGIKHRAVDELLTHLFSIATTGNLTEWEKRGTLLTLCGRGDPIQYPPVEPVV